MFYLIKLEKDKNLLRKPFDTRRKPSVTVRRPFVIARKVTDVSRKAIDTLRKPADTQCYIICTSRNLLFIKDFVENICFEASEDDLFVNAAKMLIYALFRQSLFEYS